jgi:hypothetical protein
MYVYTNIIWGGYAKFKTKPFCILSAWSLAAHLSYPGALQTCVFWGLEFKELSFLVEFTVKNKIGNSTEWNGKNH